jgi:hypothetical protein
MEEHEKTSEARSLRDYYWPAFCAALLISVVIYAVVTAT